MFATLITAALFAATTFTGVVADFNIDTPALTQCQKVTVNWDKNEGAVNLIAVHPDAPCGDVVHDFGDFTNNTLTWVVNYPAGTQLQFSAENQNGDEAWSGPMTVGKSSDTSCLTGTASASVSASGSVSHISAKPTSTAAYQTVGAAGAAVTGGSSSTTDDDSGSTGPLGAASGGSSGAAALHMNPVMVLCALFAVALAL